MKTQNEIKEIKKLLTKGNCIFTIKGIETYQKINNSTFGYSRQQFKMSKKADSISEINTVGMGGGFNVIKFTKNTIHLYTYSILHNRINAKIKYQDVTILETL
tara:strand:+ start:765 stop:1073 length:309 start_codon:yes stop_codon:yes gene_type:complete